MTSTELDRIAWRTSSYSAKTNCVQVGWAEQAGIAVRDTKHRTGPMLAFDTSQWRAFLAQLT
jgi:hypothetical protein